MLAIVSIIINVLYCRYAEYGNLGTEPCCTVDYRSTVCGGVVCIFQLCSLHLYSTCSENQNISCIVSRCVWVERGSSQNCGMTTIVHGLHTHTCTHMHTHKLYNIIHTYRHTALTCTHIHATYRHTTLTCTHIHATYT